MIKKSDDTLDWIKGSDEAASGDAPEVVSGDVILEGSLGIAEAEAMHQHLATILDAGVDISIDSEDLSRVDAAGAQLLYAFVKESGNRSVHIQWKSVSDALKEVTDTLGLTSGMGFGSQSEA